MKKALKEEKDNLQQTFQTKMNSFVNSINDHYKNIALFLLKGCFISNKSYEKIRLLLSFKMNQEETIILRSKLPKIVQKPLSSMFVNRKKDRKRKKERDKERKE